MEKTYYFVLDNYDVSMSGNVRQTRPNGMHKDVFEQHFKPTLTKDNLKLGDCGLHGTFTWPVCCLFNSGYNWNNFSGQNLKYVFTSKKLVPNNERYFYPIYIEGSSFFTNSVYKNKPIDVSEEVLIDIRNNKCKILFFYNMEGHSNSWLKHEEIFKKQAEWLNIDLKSIIFSDANCRIREVLKSHGISAYYYNNWEYHNSSLGDTTHPGYNNSDIKFSKEDIIKKINNFETREKKILNLNRRPHLHRLIMVDKILKAGIENDILLTLGPPNGSNNDFWYQNLVKMGLNHVGNRIPITYDYSDLISNNPTGINSLQLNAYINLVSETFCFSSEGTHTRAQNRNSSDVVFFSEKTFKPIICLQPFIQVNLPYSLKYLRELGYKTFHPFINEEYDKETDDFKRVNMVFEEVLKLSKLSHNDHKSLLKTLLPILIHNEEVYRKNSHPALRKGTNMILKIMEEWDEELKTFTNNINLNSMDTNNYKVAMIGLGKLGKDCAEVMATKYKVTGFDVRQGITSDNLKIVNSVKEAVANKNIIFIAVPTPHDPQYGGETPISHLPTKDFDYSIVINCLKEIHANTTPEQLIVLISTVLPGTVRKQLIQHLPNRRFIYNPYLIAMGSIKQDMVNPEMVIIGTKNGESNKDSEELINFYKKFINKDSRIVQGTWDEAESIKIFYNTFISAKLSLVNMIQDVAVKNGNINVDVVTKALKESTYRIMGPAYMTAGMGDGGACHPRDNIALRHMAGSLDLGYDLFAAIMQSREIQAKNLAEYCLRFGKDICIVGAAYKPGVPYTQGSYSYLVGYYINQLRGWLSYYDLNTGDNTFNRKAEVYLIGYWEKWVEDIAWPDNCTIIDPWRLFKTNNPTIKVIHYGNTR